MFTTTQKILLGTAIVVAFGMTAMSVSAASYVSISAGSGSYYGYTPSYYSYCNCYDAFYYQPNYYDYGYQSVYSSYPSYYNNYSYNYGGSFWSADYKAPKLQNPPPPANVAPIKISGLGFTVPSKVPSTPSAGAGYTGTPVAQAPVAAPSGTCPDGKVYSASMNLCLPSRNR